MPASVRWRYSGRLMATTSPSYPRNFVMSSVGAIAGLATAAKVPYFPRVKNQAAAGDKTGLAAGLAFTPGISATNGWVYGVNESLVYQALPLEVSAVRRRRTWAMCAASSPAL